jgi:hypothetical protein
MVCCKYWVRRCVSQKSFEAVYSGSVRQREFEMSKQLLLAALVVVAGVVAPARAGLLVTVDNATLVAGTTTSVNVYVSSDDPLGADQALQSFGFEFRITIVPPVLTFVDPQPIAYLTDPAYVFVGDSGALTLGQVGNVSPTVSPSDTFIGGDFTASFSDVLVPTTNRLLARLQISASAAAPTTVGTIALVPSLGTSVEYLNGLSNTGFLDANLNPISFSSTPGTITVFAASGGQVEPVVVPEPASLTLLAAGAGLLGWWGVRRKRMRHGRAAS